MGYRDVKLYLSTSQNVTADANSETYVDTEETNPKWAEGQPAAIIINIEDVGTAATGIQFLVCDSATDTNPTTSARTVQTVRVLAADLAAGDQIVIPLCPGITYLRYIGLYFDVIGGTEDYTLSAYFTPMLAPK